MLPFISCISFPLRYTHVKLLCIFSTTTLNIYHSYSRLHRHRRRRCRSCRRCRNEINQYAATTASAQLHFQKKNHSKTAQNPHIHKSQCTTIFNVRCARIINFFSTQLPLFSICFTAFHYICIAAYKRWSKTEKSPNQTTDRN